MTFFHTRNNSSRNALAFQRSVRRVLAVICVAVSVCAALSCVRATVRTMPAVIAAHAIARDATITADDLTTRTVPYHESFEDAAALPDAIAGMTAAVPIPAGSLITFAMVRATPLLADNATMVQLALSSASGAFAMGTRVRLVTSGPCPDANDDSPQETTAYCTIADNAVVMGPAETDETGVTFTPLGLDADDALRALNVHTPIVAVQR